MKLTQDETGKQLRQREVLATELAGVIRQRAAAQIVGRAKHRPWRFAGFHPFFNINLQLNAQISRARMNDAGRDRASVIQITAPPAPLETALKDKQFDNVLDQTKALLKNARGGAAIQLISLQAGA